MTDLEFYKKMIEYSYELKRLGDARPYDPDAYNAFVDKLNKLPPRYERGNPKNLDRVKALIVSQTQKPSKRRRRRPWMMFAFLFVLAVILGMIVVLILDAIII